MKKWNIWSIKVINTVCACANFMRMIKDGEHFNLKKENFHIAYFPFGKSGVMMAHL